jgi:hypothetical protein
MPTRDNGFVARHYVPLADLDPRLADAMLDLLREENIAAYASPSTGRLGGYLEVILPERPRDRLWVDREQRDRAAVLLAEHTDPETVDRIDAGAAHPADSIEATGIIDDAVLKAQAAQAVPPSQNAQPDELAAPAERSTPDPSTAADGQHDRADLLPHEAPATSDASQDAAGGTSMASAPADPAGHATGGGPGHAGADQDQPQANNPAADDQGSGTEEVDPAWAAILASFELPSYEPPAGHPSVDTRTAERPVPRRVVRPAEPAPAPVRDVAPVPPSSDLPAATGWDPLDLLDEHFVPPRPPPAPRLQAATRWALAAIVVGLALIIGPHLSDSMPGDAAALGVFLMIGGLVALVANMRDDRGNDRDDDGAVV